MRQRRVANAINAQASLGAFDQCVDIGVLLH